MAFGIIQFGFLACGGKKSNSFGVSEFALLQMIAMFSPVTG